ncbi:glycosyltransferase family 2 protein [Klebsiella pneumoniae]|uniref:glycosyltransferase family 2 protein n=1 Tax=Klebsiella pneumoniae TaxID=573 RepID=UPI0027B8E06E|nr:glycosyltransferase [Klebsiella pneumoniae]EKZ5361099.1 glycosyltransferase family 2 protein [Klebsiella pneumoniae]WLX53990.1 glycosyltransferase [Klebsiella pneumoniae]
MKVFIGIPTFNGGKVWQKAAENIRKYSPPNTYVQVIDSGSTDDTVQIALKNGFNVVTINAKDFNHGKTRNDIVNLNKNNFDIVIFLTQDAIPEPDFINNIISVFEEPLVACAYGRQLPHLDANAISTHARYFNYPNKSYVSSKADISVMGLKTVFSSNSFAAYKIDIFEKLGGFPGNTILSEDMFFAAKSIMSGFKVAYVPSSKVRHSHNYSAIEEFKRYFDIGVFHATEKWIRKTFGGAGGEGKKFLYSEFKYLLKNQPSMIPQSMMNNMFKIIGYKLGQNYSKLPLILVKKCSMHKRFWKEKNNSNN